MRVCAYPVTLLSQTAAVAYPRKSFWFLGAYGNQHQDGHSLLRPVPRPGCCAGPGAPLLAPWLFEHGELPPPGTLLPTWRQHSSSRCLWETSAEVKEYLRFARQSPCNHMNFDATPITDQMRVYSW